MSQAVAIINNSTAVSDADVQNWVAAFQAAVDNDFGPAWDLPAQLTFVPSDGSVPVPAGAWSLFLLDNSDQQGALGYHGIDANGLPFAKAFVADDIAAGFSPTVTITHELFEMLVDPYIQLLAGDPTQGQPVPVYEVGDPVEADANGYTRNGVLISDFATPAWFTSGGVPGPFDFTNQTSSPGQLTPGGYMSYYDPNSGQFVQNFGQAADKGNSPARDRRGKAGKPASQTGAPSEPLPAPPV
jgi:hypothetical protein